MLFTFTQPTVQKLIDTRNKAAYLDEKLDAFAEFMAFGSEGADQTRLYEMDELAEIESEVLDNLHKLEENTVDDKVVNESTAWAAKYLAVLDALPGKPSSLDEYEDLVQEEIYRLLADEINATEPNIMKSKAVLTLERCEGTLVDFVNWLALKAASGALPDENYTTSYESLLVAIQETEIAVTLALHIAKLADDKPDKQGEVG